MRTIILAGALMAMAPLALAQPYTPGNATPPPPAGTTYSPNGSAPPVSAGDQGIPPSQMQSQNVNQSQPDPNNCGTPDEPKACPPLPRRPLASYPQNR
jgi:hypothetical protein